MKEIIYLYILLICNFTLVKGRSIDNSTYWTQRNALLKEDYSIFLGHDLILNPVEKILDTHLKGLISMEIEDGVANQNFPPSKNFMVIRETIEASEIFSIIREMPKGAVLHCHDTSITSLGFVISNLTYMDNLYICYEKDVPVFKFSLDIPDAECDWELVADARSRYSSEEEYDAMLLQKISLVVEDPHTAYPDIDVVWDNFNQYFQSINGLFTYREAFEAYLTQAMTEFMEDKVSYFEFRGTLPSMYQLDGSVLDPIESMEVYENVINNFTTANSEEFYGVRFIYGPFRHVPMEQVETYVAVAATIKEKFNDTVAGFDLVGQEDAGYPLKDFIDPILEMQDMDIDIPVFFHAGETNWYGTTTDENIADALLLRSQRLGHAYAIAKHPALLNQAIQDDIPLEISPISNQVLKLVEDLRNHPAATFISRDVPLVISSDDPAAWGALPLSHDWYEALMAFGGKKGGLKFLKQLALNSIKYSSLSQQNKDELETKWRAQWNKFVNETVSKLVYKNHRCNNTR